MPDVTCKELHPGLCGSCVFARVIENARGSRFYLCRRSETDARYAKYPRIPVRECAGFVSEGSAPGPRRG